MYDVNGLKLVIVVIVFMAVVAAVIDDDKGVIDDDVRIPLFWYFLWDNAIWFLFWVLYNFLSFWSFKLGCVADFVEDECIEEEYGKDAEGNNKGVVSNMGFDSECIKNDR